jgi:DNA-binding NarL/FixJ family response regulator
MIHSAESRPDPRNAALPLTMLDGRPSAEPRVFLVDDNAGLRGTLRDLFTDAGIEVVGEAGDSAEALRRIPPVAYERPLIVLMDVRMPGPINGIEATRLVIDRCERVAVIIFTAFPGAGIEQASRHAGAVEMLTKGCPASTIVTAIQHAWSRMQPVGG